MDELIKALKDNVNAKMMLINALNNEIIELRELLRRALVIIQVDLPRSNDTRKVSVDIRSYFDSYK